MGEKGRGWKDVVQDGLALHYRNTGRHQENALPAAGRNPAKMRGFSRRDFNGTGKSVFVI